MKTNIYMLCTCNVPRFGNRKEARRLSVDFVQKGAKRWWEKNTIFLSWLSRKPLSQEHSFCNNIDLIINRVNTTDCKRSVHDISNRWQCYGIEFGTCVGYSAVLKTLQTLRYCSESVRILLRWVLECRTKTFRNYNKCSEVLNQWKPHPSLKALLREGKRSRDHQVSQQRAKGLYLLFTFWKTFRNEYQLSESTARQISFELSHLKILFKPQVRASSGSTTKETFSQSSVTGTFYNFVTK